MLELCFLGGVVKGGTTNGPDVPAEAGAKLRSCFYLHFSHLNAAGEDLPVKISVGTQILSGDFLSSSVDILPNLRRFGDFGKFRATSRKCSGFGPFRVRSNTSGAVPANFGRTRLILKRCRPISGEIGQCCGEFDPF